MSIKRPPTEAVEIAKIQRKLDLRLSALWWRGKEGAGEDGWVGGWGCVADTNISPFFPLTESGTTLGGHLTPI